MIVKKNTWSNWAKINKYAGIEIEAIKEDKDENLKDQMWLTKII